MTARRLFLFITLIPVFTSAQADWSANIGWASDYYYRGRLQKCSSASGGVAFTDGGFYAGVWAADVG